MDECDTYYTALILDPRVKGALILDELDDKEAGSLIIEAIRNNIHQRYSKHGESPQSRISRRSTPETTRNNVESQMIQRLQPPTQPFISNINQYFDSPRVSIFTLRIQNGFAIGGVPTRTKCLKWLQLS